jgi:hypothetical protein
LDVDSGIYTARTFERTVRANVLLLRHHLLERHMQRGLGAVL